MGKKEMLAVLGWVVLNKTDHLKKLNFSLGWIHQAQGTDK
jgi:hypothetical protein